MTGTLLRLPIWDKPKDQQLYDDSSYWTLPEEGFPYAACEEQKAERNGKTEAVDSV